MNYIIVQIFIGAAVLTGLVLVYIMVLMGKEDKGRNGDHPA